MVSAFDRWRSKKGVEAMARESVHRHIYIYMSQGGGVRISYLSPSFSALQPRGVRPVRQYKVLSGKFGTPQTPASGRGRWPLIRLNTETCREEANERGHCAKQVVACRQKLDVTT